MSPRVMKLFFLLSLFACAAFAQPVVTRGGALKKRQYQTYATMSLFVDPTGNDANACTASGTAACLTVQGAINKVPKVLRHNVTITAAAGTYSGNIEVNGFNLQRQSDGTAPTFTITGSSTWTNVTPTTGTASGTVNGYLAPALATLGYIEDTTQSWTTNEFKGASVVIGSVARVIVGNTATRLSIGSVFTSPVGSAYAIQLQSTILSGTAHVGGNVGSASSTGGVVFSNFTLTNSSTTPLLTVGAVPSDSSGTTAGFVLQRLRLVNTSTGGNSNALSLLAGAQLTFGSTTGSVYITNASTSSPPVIMRGGTWRDGGSYIRAATGSSVSAVQQIGGVILTGNGQGASVYEASPTTDTPTLAIAASTVTVAWPFFLCGAGGLILRSSATGTGMVIGGTTTFAAMGIGIPVAAEFSGGGLTIDTGAYGVRMYRGSRLLMGTTGLSPLTFTSVTNELILDNEGYSFATFNGLTPRRICSPEGSCIIGK